MSEKFPKKWPKLDPAVWKLFEAQISSMREMAEWYNINKESPVCSDKQVIEDAVTSAAREVVELAKHLGVTDMDSSAPTLLHRLYYSEGHVIYRDCEVYPDKCPCTYCQMGPRLAKATLKAADTIKRQMTRAAKRRKKLADKLRPKVSKPFLIDERGRTWGLLSFVWQLFLTITAVSFAILVAYSTVLLGVKALTQ